MRFSAVLAGAFALLAYASPEPEFGLEDSFDTEFDALEDRKPCHPAGVHVIAASGAGRNNLHQLGLLQSLGDVITLTIPQSTLIKLPYPKGAASFDAPDPGAAIETGTHNMRRYIRKFYRRCRNTPIVLIGYSSGSVMATNNVCGGMGLGRLPPKLRKNVIAVVGYGDETFSSGQTYNAGTCTAGAGLHPRPADTCYFFSKKLKQYCDAPDPDCCGGDDTDAHFEYPKYDNDALAFIQARHNAWVNKHS